jgi:hypothetical protein
MPTNKEQIDSTESYSPEDSKLIISLLHEYSEKLLNACEKIDRYKRYYRLNLMLATIFVYLIIPLNYTRIYLQRSSSSIKEFLLGSLIALFIFIFIAFISDIRQRIRLLIRDTRTLCLKLQKIIRFASQVQEHVLINFASRIELDLRIADAESALQRFELSTKDTNFFQSLVRLFR